MKLMLYNLKKLFKLHWWQDEELVDQLAEIIIKLDDIKQRVDLLQILSPLKKPNNSKNG